MYQTTFSSGQLDADTIEGNVAGCAPATVPVAPPNDTGPRHRRGIHTATIIASEKARTSRSIRTESVRRSRGTGALGPGSGDGAPARG